jgi:hypothetical protein
MCRKEVVKDEAAGRLSSVISTESLFSSSKKKTVPLVKSRIHRFLSLVSTAVSSCPM